MEIKDILKEAGLSSTAHALPNIIRAKQYWLKTFWTILLTISSTGCFILLRNDISNFFAREVVSQITVTNEISSVFPSIRICNKNYFRSKEELSEFDLNKSVTYQNKSYFDSKLRNLILRCDFSFRGCNLENDFVWDYDLDYGVCFNFNSGKNQTGYPVDTKILTRVGKNSGLKLKIQIERSEISYKSEISAGLMVLIYNSSINYSINRVYEAIDVSNGLETNIIINRLLINKKEYPYSKCVSDIQNYESDIVRMIFNLGYFYRQKDCLDICIHDLVIENFGCYFLGMLYTKSILNVTNLQSTSCKDDIFQNLSYLNILSSENTAKTCESKCPLECSSIQYNPIFYYGTGYPIIKSSSELRILLNIFYDSLSYTTIEEIAKMEFTDLFSNTGGTLGLFLGISLLSFGEIFEIIFVFIVSIFKRRESFANNTVQIIGALSLKAINK